jgi:hypothetical protein
MPYDQFAIQALFKPIGVEQWWFQFTTATKSTGAIHRTAWECPRAISPASPTACCAAGSGTDQQVIPKWFVDETAAPTHDVRTPELRWKLNPQIFLPRWELPARHSGESGRSGAGIPADARHKPGSGGQLIAFVPSLDLVITRQTGSSGEWQFEEISARACAAVRKTELRSAKFTAGQRRARVSPAQFSARADHSLAAGTCTLTLNVVHLIVPHSGRSSY